MQVDTAVHHASSDSWSQCNLTVMPSANLIQSAKWWLGTAITTGISSASARSIRWARPFPLRSCRPKRKRTHAGTRFGLISLRIVQSGKIALGIEHDPDSLGLRHCSTRQKPV